MNRKILGWICLITILTACLPLFTVNCIGGHDITYHLLRIEALKTGIQNGHPFLRVNMLFCGGMGYASSMFYPDLLLYLPALLRVSGVGINLSYHIFIGFCIAAGFASSFFCMRSITKDDLASVLTAVIFTLYQYHLDDIYTRSAVGEFTAMIFLPFVITGLYDLVYCEFKRPLLLGTGMAGVLLCHTLTTFLCLVLCIAAVLVGLRRLIKAPRRLALLFLTTAAVLAVTAFYWLPMLEQILSGTVRFNGDSFDVSKETLMVRDIFFNHFPAMGISVFLLLLPRICIKEKTDLIRFGDLCTLAAILFALGTTALFPWERLKDVLSFIQFPYRLFVLSGPLLSVSAGIYLTIFLQQVSRTDSSKAILAFVVLGIMSFSAILTLSRNDLPYYSYSNDYFDYAPYTSEVIGGEWLPPGTTDRGELISGSQSALLPDGQKLPVSRKANSLDISDLPSSEYIDVPFLYYKGYAAVSDTKKDLRLDGSGSNGRIRVYPDGATSVHVYYRGTVLQKVSDLISFLTCLGLAVFYSLRAKRQKAAPV